MLTLLYIHHEKRKYITMTAACVSRSSGSLPSTRLFVLKNGCDRRKLPLLHTCTPANTLDALV
eukprot:m.367725 g.367725  ORF g.367725 m.367725 type:complete len:63 (+) comp42266_c0_seq1:83-271(+)